MSRHPLLRARIWLRDRGLSILVSMLALFIFVISPLADMGVIARPLFGPTIAVVLAAGLFTVARSRIAAAISLTLGFALLPLQLLFFANQQSYVLHSLFLVDAILFIGFLGYGILREVFAPGIIDAHRIIGAVGLYLLIGVFFSMFYQLLLLYAPDAISYPARPGEPPLVGARMTYYSFTTLTSMGYGDIVPVNPLARTMAILEAIVGQLYPAILLGRLVSLTIRR